MLSAKTSARPAGSLSQTTTHAITRKEAAAFLESGTVKKSLSEREERVLGGKLLGKVVVAVVAVTERVAAVAGRAAAVTGRAAAGTGRAAAGTGRVTAVTGVLMMGVIGVEVKVTKVAVKWKKPSADWATRVRPVGINNVRLVGAYYSCENKVNGHCRPEAWRLSLSIHALSFRFPSYFPGYIHITLITCSYNSMQLQHSKTQKT